jgi:hypothetical protein
VRQNWGRVTPYYIRIRTNLLGDKDVVAMAERLSVSRYDVAGRLIRTWAWADCEADDEGHVYGVSADWLDTLVDLSGWAEALQSVGWLSVGERGVLFPKWQRHRGDAEAARPRARPKKKPSGKKASVPPELAEENTCGKFLRWWMARYEETQGTPYIISGKDRSIAGRLLRQIGPDELQARAERFLAVFGDGFVEQTGRTLGVLSSCINKPSVRGLVVPEVNGKPSVVDINNRILAGAIGRDETSQRERK